MNLEQAETLRSEGLELILSNEPERAREKFDAAALLTDDDELLELITINRGSASIRLEDYESPDVKALPAIVMRRRSARHTYLAAYHLCDYFGRTGRIDRARHYGQIALEAALDSDRHDSIENALTSLGNVEIFDSNFDLAASYYERALAQIPEGPEHEFRRAVLHQNLGYTRIQQEDPEAGVHLLLQALDELKRSGSGFVAESYIDLCNGFLDLDRLTEAKMYGELGLEHLTDRRQERNVHYLLGEIAHRSGDRERAEYHFEYLASFYPDFPHLKSLLYSVDLRKMVNWKL